MPSLSKFCALAAAFTNFLSLSRAHTWTEELQVIGPNGSYIGDRGYTRGYVARTDPTFDGDASILWLLPSLDARMQDDTVRLRINSSDYLCHPSQRTSNYSNTEYPKLKVSPGGYVAMKYLENGHVTLPWNQPGKPLQGGTVFVYGTSNPSTTEKIADVLQWNAQGTGGNGRGSLLTAQTYDDGRCHQINDCVNSAIRQTLFPNKVTGQPDSTQQEQWCETDLMIPSNQKLGDLTLYWVWQWPTGPNADCVSPEGKDEYYTSCIDVEIVNGGPNDVKIEKEVATNTLLQEDFQTQAVSTYKQRTALTASPSYILDNWRKIVGQTFAASPAFTSSCVSVLASVAANAGQPPPSCPNGLYATGALFASISSSVMQAPGRQLALVTAAAPAGGFIAEVVKAAATTQGHGVGNAPPAPTGSVSASAGSAPGGSAPAPSGSVDTVMSTFIHTTTLTKVVTAVASGNPVQPSSQGESQQPTQGGQHGGGGQREGGHDRGGHHFHFNTIAHPATASGVPPHAVGAGASGVAFEHLENHRRHPRRFR